MNAAAHLDGLGLPFVLACLVVYFALVFCYLRLFSHRRRVERAREQRAERLEITGSITSISAYIREREEADKRARWRHHTRHTKDVA